MDKQRTRGKRRDRDRRHSLHEAAIYHRVLHERSWNTCDCAKRPLGRLRKAKALACRCRGKRQGNPKLAGSMHKAGYTYRITTMRRIWNRRLARAWLAALGSVEPQCIELASGAIVGRRLRTRSW